MFRKTSGSILCPTCGRLTNADAPACLICGRRNPGMWGFAGPLSRLFRRRRFTDVVTVACIVLYIASLVLDLRAALVPRGIFDAFSPGIEALFSLGAAGSLPWSLGRWWTLVTAIYLHGGLLHIIFNVLWIRQLGPAVEELYGAARMIVIFTVSGAVGFIASNIFGDPFTFSAPRAIPVTIGASGAIFGLLGAIVAYGQRRGGSYGVMILRQYAYMALLIFVLSFFMRAVNNTAHAGGFVGGYVVALALSFGERRAERGVDYVLAAICIGVTVLGFVLNVWTTFVR